MHDQRSRMLRILLLGSPIVSFDQQPVHVQRKMQRGLLYYLACQEAPVSRAKLMLLLWNELPEQEARRKLRQELSRLRAQLPDGDVLIVDHELISLDRQKLYVDVSEYNTLVQQAWTPASKLTLQRPLPNGVSEMLFRAAALWRSPNFMDGANTPTQISEYDNWMQGQSQTLELSHQNILERLGYHLAATGDLENAIQYLLQALTKDEFNESLHHQVLSWMQQSGRTSDALRRCAVVSDLFEREDGQMPDALGRLCKKIEYESRSSKREHSIRWPVFIGLQVPFVGRQNLLNALSQAYARGGVVVLSGEAGSGKTRLVHQMVTTLPNSPRLLLAPSHAGEQDLPYQPLIHMLRSGIEKEEWLELEAIHATSLVRLLPELAAVRHDLRPDPAQNPQEARANLFEAVRVLLLTVAKKRRLLVFIDDVQWCDESTLSALAFLQERGVFVEGGLLVLATRLEETNPHLSLLLRQTLRQMTLTRLSVPAMDLEEIAELTQVALGQPPGTGMSARLAQATGGNTLCLLETLRAWLASNKAGSPFSEPESLPRSANIRDLLHERLEHISESSRKALEVAAVIGREFDPQILALAGKIEPEACMLALEELEQKRLITAESNDAAQGGYTFVHDLFREALLADMSLARHRLLHQRVADVLETAWKGQSYEHAAVLAGHYEAAGAVEKAFQNWLRAAEHARRLLSPPEGTRRLPARRRSAFGSRVAPGRYGCIPAVHSLGKLAIKMNTPETAGRIYGALLRQGELRGSALLIGSALSGLGVVHQLLTRHSEGLAHLDQALPYLREAGDRFEELLVYSRKGFLSLLIGKFDQGVRSYEYAVELGRGSGDPRIRQELLEMQNYLSMAYCMAGWPVRALPISEQLMQENNLLQYRIGQIAAHLSSAAAYFFSGKFQQALEHAISGRQLAEMVGSPRSAAMMLVDMSQAELYLGRLDESWKHSSELIALGQAQNFPDLVVNGIKIQGELLLWQGSFAAALELFQQASDVKLAENSSPAGTACPDGIRARPERRGGEGAADSGACD